MRKRILAITDPHCGSMVGLTPPGYQLRPKIKSRTKRNKHADVQHEAWETFDQLLNKWKPFDLGFFLGDMVDGKGKRSGGTELITSDMLEQAEMAVSVCNHVRLKARRGFKWIGVYGTPYHSSPEGEDIEQIVANDAGFEKLGSHEWPEINGCVFDLKHKIGSSAVPHGRFTAAARDALWNDLWALEDLQPRAQVVLRGHVHYHAFCGGPGKLAMTLPALQGMGTKFGSRQCSGIVHWGITVFDVESNGQFSWHTECVKLKSHKAETIKL